MERLITNFNNEISFKDALKAGFNGSELITIAIILVISLSIAISIAYAYLFDEWDSYVPSTKNDFKGFVKISSKVFAVCFFVIMILTLLFNNLLGKVRIREKRLKEIIVLAQEENLSKDMIIDKDVIIYKNTACKHGFSNIYEYVIKNGEDVYVFIED